MTGKSYTIHFFDKGGVEFKHESGRGFPADLNNPNFQLSQTLSPTPPQASTGCEQRVCRWLSSTNSYPSNGATVKIQSWEDSASHAVLRIERDVTGGSAPGFYALGFEYY